MSSSRAARAGSASPAHAGCTPRARRCGFSARRDDTVSAALAILPEGVRGQRAATSRTRPRSTRAVAEVGGRASGASTSSSATRESTAGGPNALELDAAWFRRVLDVNVIGVFLLARACARRWPTALRSSSTRRSTPCGPSAASSTTTSRRPVRRSSRRAWRWISLSGESPFRRLPGYVPTRMTAPYLDDAESRAEITRRPTPRRPSRDPDEVAGPWRLPRLGGGRLHDRRVSPSTEAEVPERPLRVRHWAALDANARNVLLARQTCRIFDAELRDGVLGSSKTCASTATRR